MAKIDDANPHSQSPRTSRARRSDADVRRSVGPHVRTPSSHVYVFEYRRRRNGRRRYTLGTRGLQHYALGASAASNRVARGIARGMATFYRGSRRSSERRRDGIIRDAILNATRGFRDASRQLGRAPYVFARQMQGDTRRFFRSLLGYR